jgi:hypothetical protein
VIVLSLVLAVSGGLYVQDDLKSTELNQALSGRLRKNFQQADFRRLPGILIEKGENLYGFADSIWQGSKISEQEAIYTALELHAFEATAIEDFVTTTLRDLGKRMDQSRNLDLVAVRTFTLTRAGENLTVVLRSNNSPNVATIVNFPNPVTGYHQSNSGQSRWFQFPTAYRMDGFGKLNAMPVGYFEA